MSPSLHKSFLEPALANCGLRFSTLRFFWFGQKDKQRFYPFPYPYDQKNGRWFEADDEAILCQQERASLHTNIFIAKVLGEYNLELDHGHYRLRYSLLSTGRRQLIRDLLAEKGITQYELADEVSEGRMLPSYQDFDEIEDCSGTVVTPTTVYNFWLDWENNRHTLGDGRSYLFDGKKQYFWREYAPEDRHGRDIEEAQRRLLLRKRVEISDPNGPGEIWELREEDTQQFAD